MKRLSPVATMLFFILAPTCVRANPVNHSSQTSEDDGDFDGDGLFPDQDPDDAEFTDGLELRANRPSGVVGHFGNFGPWQTAGVSFQHFVSHDRLYGLQVGGSHFKANDIAHEQSYALTSTTKNLTGIWRGFFSESMPLFWQVSAGATQWVGAMEASVASEKPREVNFSALGGTVATGLGLQMFWDSGLMFEYALLGVGKSFVVTSAAALDDIDGKDVFKKATSPVQVFGLINASLGYFF